MAQFYSRLKVFIFTSILKSFDLFCSLVSGPARFFLLIMFFVPIWTFAAFFVCFPLIFKQETYLGNPE